MKKMSVVMIALSLAVSMFSLAYAGGCGNCLQQGATADPYRKFQADTIDLRQEMMSKRFEVQRENLKATPDQSRITALQGEIRTLQARILDIRKQSGLANDKCDGECDQMTGGCNKKSNAGCGKGGGCNGAPCGGQK